MSQPMHIRFLQLLTIERDDGSPNIVDVSADYGAHQCVRLSVGRGTSLRELCPEVHLSVEQAEYLAEAILAAVREHKRRGSDPGYAGRTINEEELR